MDVRSIEEVAPVVEHNGTVPVWWLVTPAGDVRHHRRRPPRAGERVRGRGRRAASTRTQHPTHEFYYVTSGPGDHDDRRRGARDRPGRPRAHPARRGAQPAPGQRPRADPLLLLRGGGPRRRRDQLHRALTDGAYAPSIGEAVVEARARSTVLAAAAERGEERLLPSRSGRRRGEHGVELRAGTTVTPSVSPTIQSPGPPRRRRRSRRRRRTRRDLRRTAQGESWWRRPGSRARRARVAVADTPSITSPASRAPGRRS